LTILSLNFSLFFPMPIRNFRGLFRNNYDFFRTRAGRVHYTKTCKITPPKNFKFDPLSIDSEHLTGLMITQFVK